jgi:hypothetical protein
MFIIIPHFITERLEVVTVQEKLEVIGPDSRHLGALCNYCAEELAQGDECVECPRCHKVHHADCWKAKGGCATRGCPQVAQVVIGEKPKGDGPPPPLPKWYFAAGAVLIIAIILISVYWPKPPDPAAGRAKIVVMDTLTYESNTILTEAVEEFNESSTTTYIDLQLLPSMGMDQKLIVLIAAGDAPDIFSVDDQRFEYLQSQGVLLELGKTPDGEPIYGVQHPGSLNKLVIWGDTAHPEIAREVLDFLLETIPQVDHERLRELREQQSLLPGALFGF